ncbi:MAG: hypothetical protein H8E61_09290 [Bacteroidetes bacterium]|nr:hypothetical protein [Bacteroidota bacterium]
MRSKLTDAALQKMKQYAELNGIKIEYSVDKNRWGQLQSKLTFTTFYKGTRIILASFMQEIIIMKMPIQACLFPCVSGKRTFLK